MIRPIPMYLWLRWKLGHGEFKPYGRSNPVVRPNVGFGGKGQSAVPARWWDELKLRWPTRNPFPLTTDPAAFFRRIGFGTAWGWANGQLCDRAKVEAGTITAADLRPALLKLKARGAQYVVVQDLVETRPLRDALKQACKELGLGLGVWEWAKSADQALGLIAYWQPDAYLADIEHYGPWADLAAQVAQKHPALPRAIWTTFTGAGAAKDGSYDRAQSAPWINNGFVCITQAYVGENPQATPAMLDWTAKTHLGYPETIPSPGIYNGWTIERYLEAGYLSGFPSYLAYLAEYLPEFP